MRSFAVRHQRLFKRGLAVLLAVLGTLFTLCATTDEFLTLSNSVLSPILLVLYYQLFSHVFKQKVRPVLPTTLTLGLLFAAFMVVGTQFSLHRNLDFSQPGIYLAILCTAPVFAALLMELWWFLDKHQLAEETGLPPAGKAQTLLRRFFSGKHAALYIWLIIFCSWLPTVPSGNQREFTQIARMRYNPHKKQWRNKQCRDTR